MPVLPEEVHGQLVIMGMLAYAGEADAGERAMAPFRALATPMADLVRPMPYAEMFPVDEGDDDYHPTAVARTLFVDTIGRSVGETVVRHLEASDASMRVAQLRVLGEAMARVAYGATAFAHRQSRIMVNVAAFYDGPDDRAGREAWGGQAEEKAGKERPAASCAGHGRGVPRCGPGGLRDGALRAECAHRR